MAGEVLVRCAHCSQLMEPWIVDEEDGEVQCPNCAFEILMKTDPEFRAIMEGTSVPHAPGFIPHLGREPEQD